MTLRLFGLVGGLLLFAVAHSVLASEPVRRRGERALGDRPQLYRLLYNLVAVGLLVATLHLSRGDWPVVWQARGAMRIALLAVEALALVGFIASVVRFDLPQFLGLRSRPFRGQTDPLRTDGVYRLCRHPLYFFTCLAFSAWPIMNLRWLVVAVWLWTYSWIGSVFEERKLESTFGEAYRRYRDAHWRLLPFGSKRARRWP